MLCDTKLSDLFSQEPTPDNPIYIFSLGVLYFHRSHIDKKNTNKKNENFLLFGEIELGINHRHLTNKSTKLNVYSP